MRQNQTRLSMKRGRKPTDLSGHDIDWSRPASHIAFDLGLTTGTVIAYMCRNGITVRKPGIPQGSIRSEMRTSVIDWSKRDHELATVYNFTSEYMRQLRKRKGEPASGSAAWAEKYHSKK